MLNESSAAATPESFQLGRYSLPLTRPHIMGVLNITPDSFYDGGRWLAKNAALAQAERMAEEGAAIIDVGGESTRPGAVSVSAAAEQERVLEVIATLSQRLQLPVSVDTSTPELMRLAAAAGASLINDVRALSRLGALAAAAATRLPVCLMHIQGAPGTMQQQPSYQDVVSEVAEQLAARQQAAVAAGISPNQIILDPGFGFGKNLGHNLALLQNLAKLNLPLPARQRPSTAKSAKSPVPKLAATSQPARRSSTELSANSSSSPAGPAKLRPYENTTNRPGLASPRRRAPLLVGISRKSFLGKLTGREAEARLAATIATTALAVAQGAWLIRVHDVAENFDALKVAYSLNQPLFDL